MLPDNDFNFKYLGQIEIKPYLKNLEQLDWDKYTYRQHAHEVHAQTKTVPLIWDEKFRKVAFWDDLILFQDLIHEIHNILNNSLGEGEIKTAILINLPQKSSIKRHIDFGENFKKNHRIHISLQTNEKCIFEVNFEQLNMEKGSIWEINNSNKYHSVTNDGKNDRIHLLIDFFKF
jgi:aspartyl/asparaginyl beta-hydroxylase (cupin superfamily)